MKSKAGVVQGWVTLQNNELWVCAKVHWTRWKFSWLLSQAFVGKRAVFTCRFFLSDNNLSCPGSGRVTWNRCHREDGNENFHELLKYWANWVLCGSKLTFAGFTWAQFLVTAVTVTHVRILKPSLKQFCNQYIKKKLINRGTYSLLKFLWSHLSDKQRYLAHSEVLSSLVFRELTSFSILCSFGL